MRNMITAAVFCLLMVLFGIGFVAAAETQDIEKVAGSKGSSTPPVPASPGATTVPAPPSTWVQPIPEPGTQGLVPRQSEEVPVVPVVPIQPDTTSPREIPLVPVVPVPHHPPDISVQISVPQQETTPLEKGIAPDPGPESQPPVTDKPGKEPSRIDLLPTTPLDPGKTPSEPKAADKQPRAEKGKKPDKARPERPKTQPPLTKEPPLKAEQTKPKSGDPLRIPPDAAKTSDISFLEGCWRATYPEGRTKRTLHERLCFDKNGNGKRFLEDPTYGATCTSASKGNIDAQGRLTVTNERGPCSNGGRTGATYMVCEGEGNATPCFWHFPDLGGATQRYKIPLVRE